MATNDQGPAPAMWSINADPRALNKEEAVLNVPGTPGETIFAVCQSHLRELQAEGAKLTEARTLVYQAHRGNSTPGAPSAEEHDLAVASQKMYAKVMGAAQSAAKRVTDSLKQLQSQVADAFEFGYVKTPEGISAAQMISDHVAGVARPERMKFLVQRASVGDKRTLAAVLSLPAYLSGLSDDEHATVRRVAASKFAPVAAAQLDAVEHVRRRMEHAVNDFTTLYEKVQRGFDPKRADAKRRAALIGGVA